MKILNGPSSAGKTSIAKALKQLLLDRWTDAFILSLDDYLQMSANEPIWEDDVFAIMPHMCEDIAAALQDGKTVIIAHSGKLVKEEIANSGKVTKHE